MHSVLTAYLPRTHSVRTAYAQRTHSVLTGYSQRTQANVCARQEAVAAFERIAQAYEVLVDAKQRAL